MKAGVASSGLEVHRDGLRRLALDEGYDLLVQRVDLVRGQAVRVGVTRD
jgi:hypothetical protein